MQQRSQAGTLLALALLSCLAWSQGPAVLASRVAPEEQHLLRATAASATTSTASAHTPTIPLDKKKKHKNSSSIDYQDQDPDVRSHWALLVAGSAGWFNYRHQADVFHAYQVLLAGGYRRDHIVVMAADDIAQDAENPMPGKVFNAPGGPNVYEGVRIDYRGPDVTAENFLSVLLGDAAAMAGKGSGRVVASGPHDKLFVFYSDHGAAGVLGMPNGPFLYADEFIKTLRKKHARKGFKEAVLYIEACESGSMFEGLLGNDLDIYVTTAANAVESSWATYCPTFGITTDSTDSATNSGVSNGAGGAAVSAVSDTTTSSSSSSWVAVAAVRALGWLQQQLGRITGAPPQHHHSSAAAGGGGAASTAKPPAPAPAPEFTTCLGDLYSVAWMEDAEVTDLTHETLLQQYKAVKVRTSQNFSYDQGSHVMQYGDLDIDRELAGDYEGMQHNGSAPTPTPTAATAWPSRDWTEAAAAAAAAQAAAQAEAGAAAGVSVLRRYSSPAAFLQALQRRGGSASSSSSSPKALLLGGAHHSSSSRHQHQHKHQQHQFVEQRDADLVPLAAAAAHSPCPRRRAAAAAALAKATSARLALEAAARSATARLLSHAAVGQALARHSQQQQPSLLLGGVSSSSSASSSIGGSSAAAAVEALMGPLPASSSSSSSNGGVSGAARALVGDWECLRGMVQAWEGECGQLDQYGMKLTRLFANLCNAGVAPQQLQAAVRSSGPRCGAAAAGH